ncbi:MAG: DUF937 domain-containing protein [Neisseria sp.]|nr:DUF937 domain-containing protein [Neisseria sp.]
MSIDLVTLLQDRLAGILSRYLTEHGERAENSVKAASLAVPAVTAGLLHNLAANPDRARVLYDLVCGEGGRVFAYALEEAQAGQAGRLAESGKGLLPDIFDGNAATAAAEIARQSGIGKTNAALLLPLTLVLVLSVLRAWQPALPELLKWLWHPQNRLDERLDREMLSALGIGSLGNTAAAASSLSLDFDSIPAVSDIVPPAAEKPCRELRITAVLAVLLTLFALGSCQSSASLDAAAGGNDEPAAAVPASR